MYLALLVFSVVGASAGRHRPLKRLEEKRVQEKAWVWGESEQGCTDPPRATMHSVEIGDNGRTYISLTYTHSPCTDWGADPQETELEFGLLFMSAVWSTVVEYRKEYKVSCNYDFLSKERIQNDSLANEIKNIYLHLPYRYVLIFRGLPEVMK